MGEILRARIVSWAVRMGKRQSGDMSLAVGARCVLTSGEVRVTDQTALFDSRTDNTDFYSAQETWPPEILACTEFGNAPYLVLGDGDVRGPAVGTRHLNSAPKVNDVSSTQGGDKQQAGTNIRWIGMGTMVVALLIGAWRWGAARRSR